MRRWLAIAMATVTIVGVPAAVASESTSDLRAVHGGREISLESVPLYHCHDLAYPEIRCYTDVADRDRDAGLGPALAAPRAGRGERLAADSTTDAVIESTTATAYVTFFQHSTYGGASYTASQSMSHLGVVGWNDMISSFKSTSTGRPKWWEHQDYVAPSWQWGLGAWVSYVGDSANDKITSVRNVP